MSPDPATPAEPLVPAPAPVVSVSKTTTGPPIHMRLSLSEAAVSSDAR